MALVVWCVLFFSGGREYRPRARVKYLREVPEGLPPALVGALWRMGAVTNDDLSATLLDLAVRGVLRIEPGGGTPPAGGSSSAPPAGETSFVLRLDRAKVDEVDELTRPLVKLLFETVTEDDVVTMEQLEKWAKAHPARFRSGIESWRGGVERRARELGFVEKGGGRRDVLGRARGRPRGRRHLGHVRPLAGVVAARASSRCASSPPSPAR